MHNLLSIYEFSNLTGIESSKLRYWDDFGLFRPLMRHPTNNYRYYSTEQLPALNFVTTLCELEVPLKTISEIKSARSPESILELLDELDNKMDDEMNRLRARYSIIHTRRELIKQGLRVNESEISVAALPEISMTLWPRNKYEHGQSFLEPLAAHISETKRANINLSFPIAGYHDDLSAFLDRPGCPNHFLSINPLGTHKRAAGNYLVGYARGRYGDIGTLPRRMLEHAKTHSLNISEPVYMLYLHDELCSTSSEDCLAQCSITIKNIKARSKRSRD